MSTHTMSADRYIRDLDSRALPRYEITEAARYLQVPESTLRGWFKGMKQGHGCSPEFFSPILAPASPDLLSFYDVASAHVLLSFKLRNIKPSDLRAIVEELKKEFPSESRYPLLGRNFFLFGRNVVVKKLGQRLNLTQRRQLGIKQVMDRFLAKVETDANLFPVRFNPQRQRRDRGAGYIVIDPDLAAGRPVVRGTGVPAEIIEKRSRAGESVRALALDYRVTTRAVKEAINYCRAA